MTPLVLALLLVAGGAGAAGWSQENADHRNQGRLAVATPDAFETGTYTALDARSVGQVTEGPASLALAGTLAGTAYAVDANGQTAWQQDVDGEVRNALAWTGDIIVVLPRGDTAYGLTPTGDVAWTLAVDNDRDAQLVRMASPALHPSGDVILATLAGEVHRASLNGTEAWRATVGEAESIQATPAITDDGDVIVAAFEPGREDHGILARLDGATGEEEWAIEIDAQVVGAPSVYADRLLVPLRDQMEMQARSLSDGSLRWQQTFDDRITASPTIHQDTAIVGDVSGTLRALSVSSGQERWSFNPLEDDPEADPLPNKVYTVADGVAVDAEGHAWVPYWVVDLSKTDSFPPTESAESPMYRLDADDGELLDRYENPKAIHGPGLHATGVWAASDEEALRSWSEEPSLQLHAVGLEQRLLLVTNTAHEGAWRIDADGTLLDEGEGRPPVTATYDLDPGDHAVGVTVDGHEKSLAVTVHGEGADDEPDPVNESIDEAEDEASEPAPDGGDADNPGPADDEEDERDAPVPPLAPLAALLVATGVRARA